MKELPKEVASPQEWEFNPFVATAKLDFSLDYRSEPPTLYEPRMAYVVIPDTTCISIQFQKGDKVECLYGRREHVETKYWTVKFSKNGFEFSINATDFYKLFTID